MLHAAVAGNMPCSYPLIVHNLCCFWMWLHVCFFSSLWMVFFCCCFFFSRLLILGEMQNPVNWASWRLYLREARTKCLAGEAGVSSPVWEGKKEGTWGIVFWSSRLRSPLRPVASTLTSWIRWVSALRPEAVNGA